MGGSRDGTLRFNDFSNFMNLFTDEKCIKMSRHLFKFVSLFLSNIFCRLSVIFPPHLFSGNVLTR